MLELVPLGSMTLNVAKVIRIPDGPAGTRAIFELSEARWQGGRVDAHRIGGAAADWVAVGPDGTGTIDARFTLEVAGGGGALYVQLGGRVDASKGPGTAPTYIAARFETNDEPLRWLNRIVAVGKATMTANRVEIELYELR